MDTAPAVAGVPGLAGTIPQGSVASMTAEFFLKALKDNSDPVIKSFNASLGALSQRIDDNTTRIADNSSAIANQSATSAAQQSELRALNKRVARLEAGKQEVGRTVEGRAMLSDSYVSARRAIRLWPIAGSDEELLWESVGEFLHEMMAIREDDICQDDLEDIAWVVVDRGREDKGEVVVKFFDKQKRDLVASSSPSLASKVDKEGKPTAGIRMEIPPEVSDTFRLLSRFGTRLRARHGAGTKRHIKFYDYYGSLYTNIKLPGDSSWTRVTPAMARDDLEASLREENANTYKRLAAKLVPGPRERLSKPVPEVRASRALVVPPGPSNAPDAHIDSRVLPPLQSVGGIPSNHQCVYAEAEFPPVRGYNWVCQMRRTRDQGKEEAYSEEQRGWDWSCLRNASGVDAKADVLEADIRQHTDRHFPLARVRKRSTEAPWITRRIKRLWKRKIRSYKKGGKTHRWHETYRKLQTQIAEARSGFVDLLLEEGNSGKTFYSATKKLSAAAQAPQWTVTDLFPGQDPQEVAKGVLDYYSSISDSPAVPVLEISRV